VDKEERVGVWLEDRMHQTRDRANLANQIMTRHLQTVLSSIAFQPFRPYAWVICTFRSIFDLSKCFRCIHDAGSAARSVDAVWKTKNSG
jgi:hypothetical protein